MEHSSGVIIYRINNKNIVEFFVCTPDGPYWKNKELWNFPKGHIEEGETPFKAAIREFEEETSVSLSDDETLYDYLGEIKQNSNKKVHVFIKKYNGEDFTKCSSNLCVSYVKGLKIIHHEIKDYGWMTYDELTDKGMKCYNEIFKKISNDKCNTR